MKGSDTLLKKKKSIQKKIIGDTLKITAVLLLSLLFSTGCALTSLTDIYDEFEKQFLSNLEKLSEEIPKSLQVDGKQVNTDSHLNDLSTLSDTLLTSDEISSESERAILTEALIGGTAIGVAGGALAGQIIGGSTEATLAGAAIGGLVGAISGRVIGMNQVKDIRDLQLKKEKMQKFLAAAEATNQKIANENDRLERQIDHLMKKSKKERMKLAEQELKHAIEKQKEIKKLKEDRQSISEALHRDQREKYQKHLEKLEQEDAKLDNVIAQLDSIAKTGRIGHL